MGLRFGGLGLGAICVPCGPKTYPVAIGAFLPWLSRGSHTRPKTRRSPDQRRLPTPIFVLTLAVLSLSTSLGVNSLVVRAAPGAQCFDFEAFDSSVLPLFYCRLHQSSWKSVGRHKPQSQPLESSPCLPGLGSAVLRNMILKIYPGTLRNTLW